MISDKAYNDFASALVGDIRERAKGLDQGSARIVRSRPSDHILCGFLTPTGNAPPTDGSTEADEATDLPRDSSFNMSSLGMEFMVETLAFHSLTVLQCTVQLHLYVRSLPTVHEQRRLGIWRREHALTSPSTEKVQSIIDVWRRVPVPPFTIDIPVAQLNEERKLRISLDHLVIPNGVDVATDLHTARRTQFVAESELADETTFSVVATRCSSGPLTNHWKAAIDVRLISVPTDVTLTRVALRIINVGEPLSGSQGDFIDPNLYGVHLAVELPQSVHRPTIFQELQASFRYDRAMPGVGINAQVDCENADSLVRLAAESVPLSETSRLEARDFQDVDPSFEGMSLDPMPSLEALLAHMGVYLTRDWVQKLATLHGLEREEAQGARDKFVNEIARFERGLRLLQNEEYPHIRQAFILMNASMQKANRTHTRWRLFQLIFIVSQLPELAAREYPALASEDDGAVELLWFAAGGGKTEAFLGVMLWQCFFDRLRGKRVGNTAFVRFPLRLLTFQQLQRLFQALAAADQIRKESGIPGARFSIGYLVGGTVTPNKIDDELDKRFTREGVDPKFQRVFSCPYCRENRIVLSYQGKLRLVEHRCSNSACFSFGDRLPLYITDQDIYRYLPSIIVSTVDKLALLGQNQRFTNLLGRVDLICGAHGASFNKTTEICDAAQAFAKGERPTTCSGMPVLYGPFHDAAPALLVQDELHLLNEELGTFDSHYETAMLAMFNSLDSKPWKIIGATATIQDFERQAWELYLKGSRQFPAHGTEADSSFYFGPSAERTGRIFVGLLGVGRKHTPAVTKALAIFYEQVQIARESLATNSPASIAKYGVAGLTKQEQLDLLFLYELALTYVLTRKGSDQVAEAIESRVHGDLSYTSPNHGDLKIQMFNGGVDVSQMIESIDALKSMTSDGPPEARTRGIVTTNIIGHGVDVDRFNVIVFAGFTRLVAEYIQASARVGRRYPGISIFVPTPQSERDRSIFTRFAKFHQYLDRLVDPAAVTRWPEPAMKRTLPGLLSGYLMGVASKEIGRPIATVENVRDAQGSTNATSLSQDRIVDWIREAYGAKYASPRYKDRLTVWVKNLFSSIVNAPKQRGRSPGINIHLGAMNSLRDVDEPAFIRVTNPVELKRLRRLIDG